MEQIFYIGIGIGVLIGILIGIWIMEIRRIKKLKKNE